MQIGLSYADPSTISLEASLSLTLVWFVGADWHHRAVLVGAGLLPVAGQITITSQVVRHRRRVTPRSSSSSVASEPLTVAVHSLSQSVIHSVPRLHHFHNNNTGNNNPCPWHRVFNNTTHRRTASVDGGDPKGSIFIRHDERTLHISCLFVLHMLCLPVATILCR